MLHDQAHCVSLDQKIVIVGGRQILSNQLWHQPVCVWLQTPPAARQSLKAFKRFRESEKKERAALLLRSRRNLCQVDRHISLGQTAMTKEFEFQRNACRMRLPLLLKRSDLPFTAMPCDI